MSHNAPPTSKRDKGQRILYLRFETTLTPQHHREQALA